MRSNIGRRRLYTERESMMSWKTVARAAGIILIIVSSAGAADLESVLQTHLRAVGEWDSLSALTSVASFSSVSYMGIGGKVVGYVSFPSKYRTQLDLDVVSEDKGFDGMTAWTLGANGAVRRDTPEELKPMINELYFQSYSYLLPRRNAGRAAYCGDTLIEGKTYHQLALYPQGGDSLSVFVNAQNGRIEYRSEFVTGLRVITQYSDFRTVSGLVVPFVMNAATPEAPYRMETRVDSLWINPDLPDSLFVMPGKSVADLRFPVRTDSIVVPLEMTGDALYVQVGVNGRGPYRFLLDSGAGATVISRRLADSLGIAVHGDVPVRGVGGFGSIGYGVIDSLTIGPLSWYLTRITVYDFDAMAAGSWQSLGGILGYDFFARFPMRFDFDRKEIVLYHPDASRPDAGGESLDVEIFYQIPIIEIFLDGRPVRMAFDLGAQTGAVVRKDSRWYRQAGERFNAQSSTAEIFGMGGTQTVATGYGDFLEIGSQIIDTPSVMVTESYTELPFPEYIEGFLGVDVLKRFNWVIDYAQSRIYLLPRAAPDK